MDSELQRAVAERLIRGAMRRGALVGVAATITIFVAMYAVAHPTSRSNLRDDASAQGMADAAVIVSRR